MNRFVIGLGSTLVIALVGALIYICLPASAPASTSHAYEYYYIEEDEADIPEPEDVLPPAQVSTYAGITNGSTTEVATSIHPQPVDTEPSSVTVLVNHLYTLPADYVPDHLVAPDVPFTFSFMDDKRLMRADAAAALEALFAAASEDDISLTAISGYRSYIRQNHIYLNNVSSRGEAYANQFSAPPGHSEHQTGLTMDVSSASNHFNLTYTLADLPEGQWLKENSHRFGFIIRYPEDKEAITGYSYEPWHLRYVGTELADYLYTHNLTLDEYYGVSAEEYEWKFDFAAAYALLAETQPEEDSEQEELEAELEEELKEDVNAEAESDPTIPDESEKPDMPENPIEPENPGIPETPTEPEDSDIPETPTEPEDSDIPETPIEPGISSDPVTPGAIGSTTSGAVDSAISDALESDNTITEEENTEVINP